MTIKIKSQVLTTDAEQDITVPTSSMMLGAGELAGGIVVWYRCDDAAPTNTRHMAVRQTDGTTPSANEADYVGTAIISDVAYHVFERIAGRV